MISAPPGKSVFLNFNARRPVRNLPCGSHAAFDRICGAQAFGERRIRGDGAGDADLLRAARLELRRPGVGARPCRKADRTVRGMPLRGRAFGFVRRNDPRAFPRSLRGRARNAREGPEAGRAHLRAHRIPDQDGEARERFRELRRHRDLSRFVLGVERDRREGAAAATPRQGGGPQARPDGRMRNLLRLRRHLFHQVRRDLLGDGGKKVREHRGDRRASSRARRPGLHAEHRGAAAPARRREDAGAARRRSARRNDRGLAPLQIQSTGFTALRARAVAEFGPELFEALRGEGAAIRDRSLAHLDAWLEHFEAEAVRRGATVLFAETRAEACELLIDICRRHGVRKAIKSKSMLSEEAGVNEALAANGITPIETDLGEYILQLAGEPPSHIIAPALHKSKEEVAALFEAYHHAPRKDDIPRMTREAREVLREHFLSADLGISGGNFLIAETGSGVIVTNEGNGRMVTTLPRVHVCITGIEKVLPTLEDFSTLLRLLTRSATGQSISNYVSLFTGPRGRQDRDGPEHMVFILVDAGRTSLVGGDMQEMLRCIRCGACMNHCPVYRAVGGHSYGWVYPGPMGAVLTPSYMGLANALDLPHAATLCGACSVACPVKIPLPELLRKLREKQVDRSLRPWRERAAIRLWSWTAQHARLYALATAIAVRFLRILGGRDGMISMLPFGREWTHGRFFPAPKSGRTFRSLYASRPKPARNRGQTTVFSSKQ